MQREYLQDKSSVVRIALEVPAALVEGLDAEEHVIQAVCDGVCRGVTELLETLGIPGRPLLEIRPLDSGGELSDRWLRLSVSGQPCRHSPAMLQRAFSRASDAPNGLPVDLDHIHGWLQEWASGAGHVTHADQHALAEFLVLTCLEIIQAQPEVLLGPEQAAAYGRFLPTPRGLPASSSTVLFDTAWLHSVLQDTLSLRISIADADTASQVLTDGSAKGYSPIEIAEELIGALRPDVVEIRLTPEYLRQITTADPETGKGSFGRLRDGLFYELGLRFPEFKFVPSESTQPTSFAFRINHLTTLRRTGPLPSQDAMEYLVSCLKVELLEHSFCFVDVRLVRSYLDQLTGMAPALIAAVREKIHEGRLARALRALVAEGVSVRNMKSILESALAGDEDAFAVRAPDEVRLDPDSRLVAAIRSGLRRYLSYKFAGGRTTLPVYLLHSSLEESLLAHQQGQRTLSQAERDALLDAVRTQVGKEPLFPGWVAILTSVAARAALRQALVPEFAWLPILAERELVPELRVQPLGRIALGATIRQAGYSTALSEAS